MRSAAGLALVALLGCEQGLAVGDGCERTSDCAEPLVCAGRRCREECADDRDCEGGALCLPAGPARACVPPDSEVPCRFVSDCPAFAVCAEERCRVACSEDGDCPDGQRCEGDVCDGALRTPPAEGSPDAGAPTGLCGRGRVDCGEMVTTSVPWGQTPPGA